MTTARGTRISRDWRVAPTRPPMLTVAQMLQQGTRGFVRGLLWYAAVFWGVIAAMGAVTGVVVWAIAKTLENGFGIDLTSRPLGEIPDVITKLSEQWLGWTLGVMAFLVAVVWLIGASWMLVALLRAVLEHTTHRRMYMTRSFRDAAPMMLWVVFLVTVTAAVGVAAASFGLGMAVRVAFMVSTVVTFFGAFVPLAIADGDATPVPTALRYWQRAVPHVFVAQALGAAFTWIVSIVCVDLFAALADSMLRDNSAAVATIGRGVAEGSAFSGLQLIFLLLAGATLATLPYLSTMFAWCNLAAVYDSINQIEGFDADRLRDRYTSRKPLSMRQRDAYYVRCAADDEIDLTQPMPTPYRAAPMAEGVSAGVAADAAPGNWRLDESSSAQAWPQPGAPGPVPAWPQADQVEWPLAGYPTDPSGRWPAH